jgi:membrane protease YdiL (CAAX protease family)
MEVVSKLAFAVGIVLILWVVHRWIGSYPPALPRSTNPRAELRDVSWLWLLAVGFPVFRLFVMGPWLEQLLVDRTLRELVSAPILSVPYFFLPLWMILRRSRWTAADMGLVWRVRSWSVATFALAFGFLGGMLPFFTGQAVLGFDPLPAGEFLLLIYTNTFLEEFFHRGVIQSKLERALGQGRAVVWGGVLFGLTHVALDITSLGPSEGWIGVGLAVFLQMTAGWLFGIIYMKTRSLWPGMACHYLLNWLSAILASMAL